MSFCANHESSSLFRGLEDIVVLPDHYRLVSSFSDLINQLSIDTFPVKPTNPEMIDTKSERCGEIGPQSQGIYFYTLYIYFMQCNICIVLCYNK